MQMHSENRQRDTNSSSLSFGTLRSFTFLIAVTLFVCLPTVSTAQQTQSKVTPQTYTEELRQQYAGATLKVRTTNQYLKHRSENFGTLPPELPEELKTKYQSAFAAFRDAVGKLQRVYLRHQFAWNSKDDLQRLREFGQLLNDSQLRLNEWRDVIAEVYRASPPSSIQQSDLILEMIERDANQDMFEGLVPLSRSVLDRKVEVSDLTLELIGYIGYANNDYDLAKTAWMQIKESQKVPRALSIALETIDEQYKKWDQELAHRAADQARNDNPQVELLTNKGRIVVELFEEEAPQAVANFIFLVEQGFYNKKMFFRVEEHFAAQTGCEKGDGTGNAGYTIRGEMSAPNHRNIFRGSMVLLSGTDQQTKRPNPDSGSSQFLFTMLPQPNFDGSMTVFGRVLEGLSVLGAFQRLDLTKEKERKDKSKHPDLIVEAKVLRKRNHPYVPEVLSGALP